jgi:DNA (cytosine-5)-methyltransferase 1
LFVVGSKGEGFMFPEPDGNTITLRQALHDVPRSKGARYSRYKKWIMGKVPEGGCWVDLPVKLQKEYMKSVYYAIGGRRGMARRLSWDKPAYTLTTNPMQRLGESCHPEETRPLTMREYARIQTFPDSWSFCGKLKSQYKQVANAVPVELARRLGLVLKASLDDIYV